MITTLNMLMSPKHLAMPIGATFISDDPISHEYFCLSMTIIDADICLTTTSLPIIHAYWDIYLQMIVDRQADHKNADI